MLIGRRENDPHLPKLTWSFPGGRPTYGETLEEGLQRKVIEMTGVEIVPGKIIFARVYPEKKEFLSIYYSCEYVGGNARAGEKFVEVKWVYPAEVEKHFTTSFHPNVKKYLQSLI